MSLGGVGHVELIVGFFGLTMSYYVNRGVEVEHSIPSSNYQSFMYTVNRHEITH